MNTESFDEATGRDRFFKLLDQAAARLLDPQTGRLPAEAVELLLCPLCDGEQHSHLFTKQGFDYVRCQDCGLVFVNPQLKTEYVEALYHDDETFYAAWIEVLTNPNNLSWQIPYFEEAVALLRQYVELGRLLDMGSSIGLFMQVASRVGFSCVGLELEKAAYEYANEQGLDVRRQFLEQAGFDKETFNAVTLFGVLEHLKNPKKQLQTIREYLKPGGGVMAVVPNVNSLAAMILHEDSRMFSGYNHLTHFSMDTLAAMFERTGYVVKHIDTTLTALDSILNHFQFRDPQSSVSLDFLPRRWRERLAAPEGRAEVEALIKAHDLGLRARIVATKPE